MKGRFFLIAAIGLLGIISSSTFAQTTGSIAQSSTVSKTVHHRVMPPSNETVKASPAKPAQTVKSNATLVRAKVQPAPTGNTVAQSSTVKQSQPTGAAKQAIHVTTHVKPPATNSTTPTKQ